MSETVVRWSGEIDLADVEVRQASLERAIDAAGTAPVVLDVSAVTFLDSSCLSVLIRARDRAARCGVELVLRGVPDRVRTLLRITGTLELFALDE